MSSYGLFLILVAYFQNSSDWKTEKSLGKILLAVMRFYSEFGFFCHQICCQKPGMMQPVFLEVENQDVPVVIDPIVTSTVNNVCKSSFRIQEIQKILTIARNTVWSDCPCYLHKINIGQYQNYINGTVKFFDNQHSLLNCIFANAYSNANSFNQ